MFALAESRNLPPAGISLIDTLYFGQTGLSMGVEREFLNDAASLLPRLYQPRSPHPH